MLAVLAVGCRRDVPDEIRLTVGPSAGENVVFTPESAFAEYLQLPGEHDELRITLAGYAASCDHFVAPGPGLASVTVTIATPWETEPGPGLYAWAGHEAHGGTPARPNHAYAVPTARVGRRGFVFPPGGSITLTRVDLDPHGRIDGLLAFDFPGDADHAAMSLRGRFSARICRFEKAPSP